jgi:DNA anti-recombination protein RmuC
MKEQIIKEITEKVMVKLEANKVELGAIQDLQADIKKGIEAGKRMKDAQESGMKIKESIDSIAERYNKLVKQFNREAEGIETFQNSLKGNFNAAAKNYEKVLKTALDLGIDMPKKIEQQFKELEEYHRLTNNMPKKMPRKQEINY